METVAVEKPAKDKETLTAPERVGELIGIAIKLLMIAFFAAHQRLDTGFFTARFGTLEAVCLFGPLLVSLAGPTVRALTGQRRPARPFEALSGLSMAAGSLWLVIAFPFEFAHLGDVLPGGLSSLLNWVPNALGRIMLALQVAVGLITALVEAGKYMSHQGQTPAVSS